MKSIRTYPSQKKLDEINRKNQNIPVLYFPIVLSNPLSMPPIRNSLWPRATQANPCHIPSSKYTGIKVGGNVNHLFELGLKALNGPPLGFSDNT
jgi:hypothetical protein